VELAIHHVFKDQWKNLFTESDDSLIRGMHADNG